MYEPQDVVSSVEELRDGLAEMHQSQIAKVLDHIDPAIKIWIERSPFLTLATVGSDGTVDISPRGDPAGAVKVLDPKTLAIPDRPGNRRFDSFQNILDTGRVGILFVVPNRREVVRVSGTAQLVRDRALRDRMAINGRTPDIAVVVRVEKAFYHCGKSIIRSNLWAPDKAAPVDDLPSYAEAVAATGNATHSLEELEAAFRSNEENYLYDRRGDQ